MDLARDFTLKENGKALIKPEVGPIFASDLVSSPRMSDLVSSHINLTLVTNYDGR
jgi:hypothetical protein